MKSFIILVLICLCVFDYFRFRHLAFEASILTGMQVEKEAVELCIKYPEEYCKVRNSFFIDHPDYPSLNYAIS